MFAHSLCKDPNGLISSTDTLYCVARVSQAIVRIDPGIGEALYALQRAKDVNSA
jgi:hypothetical protein